MKNTQKKIDLAELRDLKRNRKKAKKDLNTLEIECRSETKRLERLLASGRERVRKTVAEIDARIGIVEGRLN